MDRSEPRQTLILGVHVARVRVTDRDRESAIDYNENARVAAVEKQIAELNAAKNVAQIEAEIKAFDLERKVAEIEREIAKLDVEGKTGGLKGRSADWTQIAAAVSSKIARPSSSVSTPQFQPSSRRPITDSAARWR